MNRQDKQSIVAELQQDFSQSQAAFLVSIKGLNVAQLQMLRKGIRQQGGKMRLAKNTLMEIASRNIPGAAELAPYFKEQVAIIFASKEVPSIAKVLADVAKEQELLKLVAGCIESQVIDQEGIVKLASLPPREVLLAQVCGTLKAPIVNCVSTLNQLIVKLPHVLQQIAQKK